MALDPKAIVLKSVNMRKTREGIAWEGILTKDGKDWLRAENKGDGGATTFIDLEVHHHFVGPDADLLERYVDFMGKGETLEKGIRNFNRHGIPSR